MNCAVSLFAILTFILPTKIKCSCSNNLHDITTLMSQDPDFQRNPCYNEWKADQDKKLAEGDLENSAARNYEIELKNRETERENWQNSFRRTTVEKNGLSVGAIFAIIIVGLFGTCCYCIACFSSMQSDDNSTAIATTNTLQTNRNPGEFTVISTTPGLATSAFGDQRTRDLSLATSAYANLTAFSVDARSSLSPTRMSTPRQQESNVPLLPTGTINRQNSLPSYEDAVKMTSAPSRELY